MSTPSYVDFLPSEYLDLVPGDFLKMERDGILAEYRQYQAAYQDLMKKTAWMRSMPPTPFGTYWPIAKPFFEAQRAFWQAGRALQDALFSKGWLDPRECQREYWSPQAERLVVTEYLPTAESRFRAIEDWMQDYATHDTEFRKVTKEEMDGYYEHMDELAEAGPPEDYPY